MPKPKTNPFDWKIGKKTQSANEIWPAYVVLQKKKNLSKNSTKTVTWKLVPGPFLFVKN